MSQVANEVINLGETYLGFAARTYLDRQCRLHLNKPLNELEPDELGELALWVKNTAPLIMDKEEGEELAEEIYELRHNYEVSIEEDAPTV